MPELLKIVADNPSLSDALRRLLEEKFSTDKLKAEVADEILGQMVRARLVGLAAIEEAFKEIEKYRTEKESVDKVNPGR